MFRFNNCDLQIYLKKRKLKRTSFDKIKIEKINKNKFNIKLNKKL